MSYVTGVCDVSKKSIKFILSNQGRGNAAVLVVGGAEEALEAYPGKYSITLLNRKGFVRIAIETGLAATGILCSSRNEGRNDISYVKYI